jgi:hypothetical protein
MEFNSFFQSLGDNDVFSFSNTTMCRVSIIKQSLDSAFNGDYIPNTVVNALESSSIRGWSLYDKENNQLENRLWMTEGKKCEVLRVGAQDWIKGHLKIRVIVEFEPEIPEPPASTLDDIRQMINE